MYSWWANAMTALVLWGLWAFFPKLSLRYIDSITALFFETVGVFIVGLLFFLKFHQGFSLHPLGIIYAVLTGVFGTVGLYFFFSAVKLGPISVISSITALYPLITVILAFLILGERMSLQQMAGIFFALLGAFLLSWVPGRS